MIKVLIIVSGLVMFVPDAGPDPHGLTTLLVETKYGSVMTLHFPAVKQRIDRGSFRGWYVNNGGFNARFKVGTSPASIDLGARKYFPQLDQLTAAPDDAKVNPDCLTFDCKDAQGKKRVAAIVKFEGGWRTRPLLRCATPWIVPVDFGETSMSDFRKAANLSSSKPSQSARHLATGLALEAEVSALSDLFFYIGGDRQDLQLTKPEECRVWLGPSVSSCVVLEVENWPSVHIDPACNVQPLPMNSPCRADYHFSVFYDLIKKTPAERWLPHVSSGDPTCPNAEGPAQPPGVRCPPAFALP